MLGVSAEDLQLGGKILQFFQGLGNVLFRRMAFNLRIKLRHRETRISNVAFEFGDINAVGGKTARLTTTLARHPS